MPRSFLVKKARYFPSSSSISISDHRVRQNRVISWNKREYCLQEPKVVQRHQFLNLHQSFHIEKSNQYDNDKPIDYSIKKSELMAADEESSNNHEGSECSSTSTDQSPTTCSRLPTFAIDISDNILKTVTDGRSKHKKQSSLALTNNTKFTCHECGKYYATSSNLSRHKQTHRSSDSAQAKKCPHCDKVYVSMPALSMHILTHKLIHTCTMCHKAFSRPWLLQGHMRSHTGERPFSCPYCEKRFADRSNLRAHTQTHTEEKEFECKTCGKSFAVKSYLTKHNESVCQGSIDA